MEGGGVPTTRFNMHPIGLFRTCIRAEAHL